MRVKPYQRVLLTGDTAGGVWTFVTDLAAGLISEGVKVQLATFGPSVSDRQKERAHRISGLEWHHHFSKLEWMDNPWADIARARSWLMQTISAFQPDLIHLNTLGHSDLPFDLPVVLTVHSCVNAWWSAVKRSLLPDSWGKYHQLVARSLRSATLLTAPSEAAMGDVNRHYSVTEMERLAIYNGSYQCFRPAPKERFVLSVGRLWDEAKNVQALAAVGKDIEWPICLAGDKVGPLNSEISFANCRLLGELAPSELADWYGRAAIYASPAKYEPFGLSNLEAAHSGCALVLGDIASLRELWRDAAIFVDPDDRHALTLALKKLTEDSRLREEMSLKAQERAITFSHLRMIIKYRDAYELASRRHTEIIRRRACAS